MAATVEVVVSERQKAVLEKWIRSRATTSARLLERCRIVLMSAEGLTNREQGRRLGVDHQRVRRWRQRWAQSQERLAEAEREGATDRDLAALVREALSDSPRSGGPPRFTAEQLAQILAVSCEPPADSGRPVTHWTPPELADEVVKRGIVDSISPRHVDRLLKGGISVHTRASTG